MDGGSLEEEAWCRGEGCMDEDGYDWSEESELSDEEGSRDDDDEGPRSHLWPDPFDEGTEASSTPPRSARSSSSRIDTNDDTCVHEEAVLQLHTLMQSQPLPYRQKSTQLPGDEEERKEQPEEEKKEQREPCTTSPGSSTGNRSSSIGDKRAMEALGAGDATCLIRPYGRSQEPLRWRAGGAEELQRKGARDVSSGIASAEHPSASAQVRAARAS